VDQTEEKTEGETPWELSTLPKDELEKMLETTKSRGKKQRIKKILGI